MNKILRRIVLVCCVSSGAIVNAADPADVGFFRIQGPTNTAITGLSRTGSLMWTNAAVGTTCTVEWVGALGVSNDWKPFVRYPVTNSMSQVQVFIPGATPSGMVFIVTSPFQMGNCMDEGEGWTDELPLHNVYVTPFFMDQFEVTKGLWDEVYGWATNHGYAFNNVGAGKGTNYPVESVNWYDTVKWCNARSEKESLKPAYNTYEFILDEYGDPVGTNFVVYRSGVTDIASNLVSWTVDGYRLPTEAEWELAARGATSGNRFPWNESDDITHSNANYYSFGDGGATYPYDVNLSEGYPFYTGAGSEPFTSPVGSFPTNGYGLYDMAGNVSEWCWDWYSDTYYETASASENDAKGPASQVDSSGRAVRGGSWGTGAYEARCSRRHHVGPDAVSYDLGFRCVRSR